MYAKNKRQFGFIDGNGFHDTRRRALVYGAGKIGKTLALQSKKGELRYNVIGFIDDDKEKQKSLILNYPVYGGVESIGKIVKMTQSDVLIIAITQLTANKIQKAVVSANEEKAKVKIVPSLFEISTGDKQSIDLRTIDFTDLLGRELVFIDKMPIKGLLENKIVLITGACGSIGSEISRQVKSYNPSKLLLLDIDESGLHDNALRLLDYKAEWSDSVVPILCDIKNNEKLNGYSLNRVGRTT
ncbi:MAG: polysaccharide biosynthesis protein [Sphaerochaetaceae bacterium]